MSRDDRQRRIAALVRELEELRAAEREAVELERAAAAALPDAQTRDMREILGGAVAMLLGRSAAGNLLLARVAHRAGRSLGGAPPPGHVLTHYRRGDAAAAVCGDTSLDYETHVIAGGVPVDCPACLAFVAKAAVASLRHEGDT